MKIGSFEIEIRSQKVTVEVTGTGQFLAELEEPQVQRGEGGRRGHREDASV